ncbi:cupin domain-containing protein [Parashewanella tropica]|uniref:cupin domain-containing protein n=1 Tax=Parashewanella tropica TaxID=2547970 RepID=UPI00105A5BF1|nr:cupin domain-containing protein [Parashewanella tropica]
MIRNFLDAEKQNQSSAHGGLGTFSLFEVFGRDDFTSNCEFIDRQIIPPNSTVGYHKHGNNEELYIILNGTGTMTVDGLSKQVVKGDIIKNKPYGEHGLVNDSKEDLELLIIQIGIK